jgi:hypothetical protein
MGNRKYPILTPSEIIAILYARGFSLDSKSGDHRYYIKNVNGKKYRPQVDMGCSDYGADLIKLLLDETGLTRKKFYGSTKNTAKKINVKFIKYKE